MSLSIAEPLELPCGQTLPNRLIKTSMTEMLIDERKTPDARMERLYSRWGAGGFGLLVTGSVMVDRDQLADPGVAVFDDETDEEMVRRWVQAAKRGGSPVWMQLCHPGRQACAAVSSGPSVAPSAVPLAVPGFPVPKEMSQPEIEAVIDNFAIVAERAKAVGFDGVEVHGANGWLVSQFLSPDANRRQDDWGGSVENRSRFPIEVIRRIRSRVGSDFAVGIKINSADFQRGGFTADESKQAVQLIVAEEVDLIEVSGGNFESMAMLGRPAAASQRTAEREAYFLEYARTVRDLAKGVPMAVSGGFRTPAVMESAVASGGCDAIGLGRPSTVVPSAAHAVISGQVGPLVTGRVDLPLPRRSMASPKVKAFFAGLDLQWHTAQMRAMGEGRDPDPRLSRLAAARMALTSAGFADTFRGKRGIASEDPAAA